MPDFDSRTEHNPWCFVSKPQRGAYVCICDRLEVVRVTALEKAVARVRDLVPTEDLLNGSYSERSVIAAIRGEGQDA